MVIGGKGKNESKLVTLEISFISDHNNKHFRGANVMFNNEMISKITLFFN